MAEAISGEVIKKKIGRPKITTADFDEQWKKQIIDLMQFGASRFEVYAMLDISDTTFARLMREDEEFSRTIKHGERLSRAWWENIARTHIRSKEFNSTLWYMNMKNRFGWVDKTELTGKDGGPIETSTLTYMPKQLKADYFEQSDTDETG